MSRHLKTLYNSAKMIWLIILLAAGNASAQKQKVWIDADTGNETDDVYAIVRLLSDTSIKVIGLSSAHFNNADLVTFDKWNQYNTRGINTVKISQQLNEEILRLTGRADVRAPLGADRQMGSAWGGSVPRASAAAQQLIKAVKLLAPAEKLHVICLGALTNIASAIAIDTGIAAKIHCFLLGARYDAEKAAWDKNEFNIRNDLNAFDYLLNMQSIKLTVMPVNTAATYRFNRDDLYSVLSRGGPVLKSLQKRWEETNPADTVRTLWDLALAEAYLMPKLCTSAVVPAPPENYPHNITVYTHIQEAEMKRDFFDVLKRLAASGK